MQILEQAISLEEYLAELSQHDIPSRYAARIYQQDMPVVNPDSKPQRDMPTGYANGESRPDIPVEYSTGISPTEIWELTGFDKRTLEDFIKYGRENLAARVIFLALEKRAFIESHHGTKIAGEFYDCHRVLAAMHHLNEHDFHDEWRIFIHRNAGYVTADCLREKHDQLLAQLNKQFH